MPNVVDRVSEFLKDESSVLLYFVLSNMKLTLLYDAIREMRQYSETINTEKGTKSLRLADELKGMLNHFYKEEEVHKEPLDLQVLRQKLLQFKQDFTLLAHSQDKQMSEHREIWKPIVANIIIAMTGIGLLALLGNIIIQTAKSSTDKQATSFNNLFFFAKTRTEGLIEHIDNINNDIQLDRNDGLITI